MNPDIEADTYEAHAICTNCGYKNFPQWGEFVKERPIASHKCPNCECRTLILDKESQ